MRLVWLLALAVGLAACTKRKTEDTEFLGLGQTDNTSEPPGAEREIGEGDIASVQERGRMLFDMQRTLAMANEQGLSTVGVPPDDVVIPFVDVDPGGRSSQVLYLRWPADKVGKDGTVHPKDAQRWLLVSCLLAPDKVLDVQLQKGRVAEGGVEYHRAFTIIVAAESLRSAHPDRVFDLFTVPEVTTTDKKRKPLRMVTRVHALSTDATGPDLDVVVEAPKKKKRPPVLKTVVIHGDAALQRDPIALELTQPAPATVARIMARGAEAGEVRVETRTGAWEVSAKNGRIVRLGPTSGHPTADASG